MNIEQVIRDLKAEREELDRVIAFLEKRTTPVPDPVPLPRPKPEIKAGVGAKAKYLPPDALIDCEQCGKALTPHGMVIHMSRAHGVQSNNARMKAKYVAKAREKRQNPPKYTRRDEQKPPAGPVRCIDCGKGPFTEEALDVHLETCAAYLAALGGAMAGRGNGTH